MVTMRARAKEALRSLGYEVTLVGKEEGLRRRFPSFKRHGDVRYVVGPFALALPFGHALPSYRHHWRMYDEPLRLVADGLRTLRDGVYAIDVGANVGDSAALMSVGGRIRVLCVEGDPLYLPYLKRNATVIGPHVVIEECFVDSREGFVDPAELDRGHGTTSAVRALERSKNAGVPVRRLEQIIEQHPAFDRADLIKLDTDGRDFAIILSHQRYLEERMPVLFFEYALQYSPTDPERALQCIDMLLRIGYQRMVVFDNFGNRLLSTSSAEVFEDLNRYLLSNARYGQAVYYFDICAIAEPNHELGDFLDEKTAGQVRIPADLQLEESPEAGPQPDSSPGNGT
jgi:FkbM family methyltransferase